MPQTTASESAIATFITNLPAALAPLTVKNNWVLWKWETVSDKRTKVPYQPSGMKARSNDPATWATYSAVIAAYEAGGYSGIGFVLDDDIAAFDIDHCRDIETGRLHPWATQLVARAHSYTEVTISGTGLRIIGTTASATKIHRKQKVDDTVSCESYRKSPGRYIVITGHQIGTEVMECIDPVMEEVVTELAALAVNQGNGHDTSAGGPLVDELEATIVDGGRGRHGTSNSESVWWTCCEMLRRGYARDNIKKVILDSENGISEHCLAQGNPERAAERALDRGLTMLGFSQNRNGKKEPTANNIRIAMAKTSMVMRHNEFSGYPMIESPRIIPRRNLDDNDVIRFKFELDELNIKASKDLIIDVLLDAAMKNNFHPVINYFDSVHDQDDGVPRIERLFIDYCGAEDTEYNRAVPRLMMIAAVRRIYSPGAKFDEIVILEAPQGTEKSAALSILAVRDEWFTDYLPLNLLGREVLELTQGKWIVEAAELSGMRRAEVEHLKAFTSRQADRGRKAYGRVPMEVRRQFIIVGTTNSSDYLQDLTGNRRFWPVKITHVDVEALRRDRDKLWAEAVRLERAGASIRLEERLWPVAARVQEERTTLDPLFDGIKESFNGYEGKVASVELWKLTGLLLGNRTQLHNMRLSNTMRSMGWEKKVINRDRGSANGFVKGGQPYREVVVKEGQVCYIDEDPAL